MRHVSKWNIGAPSEPGLVSDSDGWVMWSKHGSGWEPGCSACQSPPHVRDLRVSALGTMRTVLQGFHAFWHSAFCFGFFPYMVHKTSDSLPLEDRTKLSRSVKVRINLLIPVDGFFPERLTRRGSSSSICSLKKWYFIQGFFCKCRCIEGTPGSSLDLVWYLHIRTVLSPANQQRKVHFFFFFCFSSENSNWLFVMSSRALVPLPCKTALLKIRKSVDKEPLILSFSFMSNNEPLWSFCSMIPPQLVSVTSCISQFCCFTFSLHLLEITSEGLRVCGSAGLGSAPLRRPLTPGPVGLGSWESCVFNVEEKLVCLYHHISGDVCEVTLWVGAHAAPGSLPLHRFQHTETYWFWKMICMLVCMLFWERTAETPPHTAAWLNTWRRRDEVQRAE